MINGKQKRLKFLSNLKMDWSEIRASFPDLFYLEKFNCPKLTLFPCDENGLWLKPLNDQWNKSSCKTLKVQGLIWVVRWSFTSTSLKLESAWLDWSKGSPIMVTQVRKSSSNLIFLIPLHRGTSALCAKCCLSSSWLVLSVMFLFLPNEFFVFIQLFLSRWITHQKFVMFLAYFEFSCVQCLLFNIFTKLQTCNCFLYIFFLLIWNKMRRFLF